MSQHSPKAPSHDFEVFLSPDILLLETSSQGVEWRGHSTSRILLKGNFLSSRISKSFGLTARALLGRISSARKPKEQQLFTGILGSGKPSAASPAPRSHLPDRTRRHFCASWAVFEQGIPKGTIHTYMHIYIYIYLSISKYINIRVVVNIHVLYWLLELHDHAPQARAWVQRIVCRT